MFHGNWRLLRVQCVKAWTLVESIKLHISSISPYGSWMYEYNKLILIAQCNESKVIFVLRPYLSWNYICHPCVIWWWRLEAGTGERSGGGALISLQPSSHLSRSERTQTTDQLLTPGSIQYTVCIQYSTVHYTVIRNLWLYSTDYIHSFNEILASLMSTCDELQRNVIKC